jgi:hypothetical protein
MAAATALLMVSCDSYRDLWEPFFTLLIRYWPDRPFPVFLGSNHATHPDRRVAPLTVGDDPRLIHKPVRMLESISSDRVLFQEDFLIDRSVQTERVAALIGYAEARQAAYLQLIPIPESGDPCED